MLRVWHGHQPSIGALVLAWASALAIGACGGSEDADSDGGSRKLIERIPVQSEKLDDVVFIDLVAAREALGLPEDAGVSEDFADVDTPEFDLVLAAGHAFRHLAIPQETPMSNALDLSQATAAASTRALISPEAVTVVETSQSFDKVAAALERDGYRMERDVLTTDESLTKVVYTAVAGRDGLIAMGGSPEAVRTALETPADPPESAARKLIASLEAPLVGALATTNAECIEAVGAAETLDGSSELVLEVSGGASSDALPEPDEIGPGGTEFGEPEVDGDRLTVAVMSAAGPLGPVAMSLLGSDLSAGVLYDCE